MTTRTRCSKHSPKQCHQLAMPQAMQVEQCTYVRTYELTTTQLEIPNSRWVTRAGGQHDPSQIGEQNRKPPHRIRVIHRHPRSRHHPSRPRFPAMRDPHDPWQDELAATTPVPHLGPTDAELRATAISQCDLCDPDGYRGTHVCDHQDHTATAKRGIAAIRAQMGWTNNTEENQ